MKIVKSQLLVIFVLLISIIGCSNIQPPYTLAKYSNDSLAIKGENNSLCFWNSIKDKFELTSHNKAITDKLTLHYIKEYTKNNAYNIKGLINKSSPYLFYVAKELEDRNMPAEIIFLPMVESAYDINAHSNMGALGIWQLSKDTAARYGLTQDSWYEGRKDIYESTYAALNYLEFLYKNFDNDWLLALAAYNAGEGRVAGAIKKNKKNGLGTKFEDLKLPSQTIHHVPKILAISHIIKNNARYNFTLPNVTNTPVLKKVDIDDQIDLNVVAKLSGLPLAQVKKHNPGLKKHTTHPEAPKHISLPVVNASKFEANILSLAKNEYIKSMPYTIQIGDSLSMLAEKNHTSIEAIIKLNNMSNNNIVIGKNIIIPIGTNKNMPNDRKFHLIKTGDSLIKIAKEHDTSVKTLMAINNLHNHNIVLGKTLFIT
ncbi:MAG: transglycosylase SLT domain-containing protein [Francisellaceae bacterium]|jgi:membrane-bound lytic murein transglycosylase D|nr:transglycosylase SLT domain-containing protein [Francisellaceae bacterium]MBT6538201.1 transglycosylase SLT domain-containing protein [Francisellaceae bacterium]